VNNADGAPRRAPRSGWVVVELVRDVV
jgi:hypothetical protein